MKITFTRNHTHYGARYRAGDQIELAQDAAERLVRDGVARVDANELMRHLRGKRRTLGSIVAHDLKVWRS